VAKKPGERDPLAREVDRLLRQLPGADPTLQSDPDQPPPRAAGLPTAGARPVLSRPPGPLASPRADAGQVWGVWGRLAGAAVLGGALTQWPYRTECGWPVYWYLGAVAALLLAAGWAAVAAWRFRIAPAHALALVVGFWGIVLAAEQILPRVGYAAEARAWRCGAVRAAPPARVPVPPAAAPAPDSAVAPDPAATNAAPQLQSVGSGR
jgi:hypothetical protein